MIRDSRVESRKSKVVKRRILTQRTLRKSTEGTEKKEEKRIVASDRKNPPFAKDAKDGAPFEAQGKPSSSIGRRRNEERSPFGFAQGKQEWLCHMR